MSYPRHPQRRLQLCHLAIPPAVAHFSDHALRDGEVLLRLRRVSYRQEQPGGLQVAIRLVQPHTPARGDAQRLVQVVSRPVKVSHDAAQNRTGQQTPGQLMLRPRSSQVRHSVVEFIGSSGERRTSEDGRRKAAGKVTFRDRSGLTG